MNNDELIYNELSKGRKLLDVISEIDGKPSEIKDVYFKDAPSQSIENASHITFREFRDDKRAKTINDYRVMHWKLLGSTTVAILKVPFKIACDCVDYTIYVFGHGEVSATRYKCNLAGWQQPLCYEGSAIISPKLKSILEQAGMNEEEIGLYSFFKE